MAKTVEDIIQEAGGRTGPEGLPERFIEIIKKAYEAGREAGINGTARGKRSTRADPSIGWEARQERAEAKRDAWSEAADKWQDVRRAVEEAEGAVEDAEAEENAAEDTF